MPRGEMGFSHSGISRCISIPSNIRNLFIIRFNRLLTLVLPTACSCESPRHRGATTPDWAYGRPSIPSWGIDQSNSNQPACESGGVWFQLPPWTKHTLLTERDGRNSPFFYITMILRPGTVLWITTCPQRQFWIQVPPTRRPWRISFPGFIWRPLTSGLSISPILERYSVSATQAHLCWSMKKGWRLAVLQWLIMKTMVLWRTVSLSARLICVCHICPLPYLASVYQISVTWKVASDTRMRREYSPRHLNNRH